MSRFYIKSIAVSGKDRTPSIISFEDGVNIIYGPSNTGKSYVISCINFMFGAEDTPFEKKDTGYDTISMTMQSADGGEVVLERKIVDKKNKEAGSNTVLVASTVPDIESKEYSISKKEYNELLLRLIGIREKHKIITSRDYATQNLTFRQMVHLFLIDEDHIFRKGPVYDNPKHSSPTACLSAVLFLLNGKDYKEVVPVEKKEIREAKKEAVVLYISRKVQAFSKQRSNLENTLKELGDVDVDAKINSIVSEIESVERQIIDASAQSRKLLADIFETSAKLEEARFLQDRYSALHSQYVSDIDRLNFIIDGGNKLRTLGGTTKCPFCDGEVDHPNNTHDVHIEASQTESKRIERQLAELQQVETSLGAEVSSLEGRLKQLNLQSSQVESLIEGQLKPRAAELKVALQSYNRISRMNREMEVIKDIAAELSADAIDEARSEDSELAFKPKDLFDKEQFMKFSTALSDAIENCGYPHFTVAALSPDSFDVVVNGKAKEKEGKGYRAFLNTIFAFTLMKFLEKEGTYSPRMLILDSPILSLKERGKEQATDGMKASLFRYIIDNCGNSQVIIAENEIPDNIDYKHAHLIEFTMDDSAGRYGFLNDVRATI